jgi:predicted NBD/HSP70 family sugar kinase
VRRHNLGRLIRILHLGGAASRADLTRLTGLNRSTVGALATDLARAGLVLEHEPVGRGVGRPSIVVSPNGPSVFALAFDLRVERTVAAVVQLGGTVVHRHDVRHLRPDPTPDDVLGHIEEMATEFLADAPTCSVCLGIGLAIPGVVRHSDGLVRFAPNMAWVDVPIAAALAGRMGGSLTVTVGNDADLGAIAEHLRGAAADAPNAVFLSGQVGVGGGIILDGRLMVGTGGYGGEVGHMVVNPEGRACRCGRRGCWETEVGEDAVVRALGGAVGASVDDLLDQLESSGHAGRLDEVGRWLGVGLANLVNIFNPEAVVFGGLLSRVLPLVEDKLRAELRAALTAPREQVRLVLPRLGRDAALLGAAESVFAPLLDDPIGSIERLRTVAA